MIETKLLRKLKELQSDTALQALQQPNQRDAFEYGYRAGTIYGLEMAVNLLLNLIDEEKTREF